MPTSLRTNEQGVALLMTVFVITLATILIFEIGKFARVDSKAARGFAESVQGDLVLKSGINLSRVLLEIPKLPGAREDWLGEPWSLISTAPSLPIGGVVGDPRLLIVDEYGKIDLNWIGGRTTTQTGTRNPQQIVSPREFWMTTLGELFTRLGFFQESYDPDSYRTIGNVGFDGLNQVAVVADWVDRDKTSFQSATFPGRGTESDAPKGIFFNRRLRNMSEVLLIPGMTQERLARLAPFIRVGNQQTTQKINVNTASPEVLTAMGIPEAQVLDIMSQRQSFPIKAEILTQLTEGAPQLKNYLGVTSQEFSAYVRIKMPNATRWAKATIRASGLGDKSEDKSDRGGIPLILGRRPSGRLHSDHTLQRALPT